MKAILVMDMPDCCDECFMLDKNSDYCTCMFTDESQGYLFKSREQKMPNCPLKPVPEKLEGEDSVKFQWGNYEDGWNNCIDIIVGD